MKKITFLALILTANALTYAQFGPVFNKTKSKVEEKINKKSEEEDQEEPASEQSEPEKASNDNPASLKTYSKFDFVPGERIIVFEDFMQDAIGDFPAKWNTNGSGEIMTVEGQPGHWFAMSRAGFYLPEFIDSLPDDFTLEYDMLVNQPAHSWGIYSSFVELEDRNSPEGWQSSNNTFSMNILPGSSTGSSSYDRRKNGIGEGANSTEITQFRNITKPVHVAFWRQKERMRVYLNEQKVWDIPKAIQPGAKLNSLIFFIQNIDDWHYLITNLRLAVGAPDTRNKLLVQNKWVTHGILFDVNSANIKPESYGTLKEIANVLKENPDLKVKIVGHTDADGSDGDNLDLSKRRAEAVKAALAKEFSIDAARLETEGKGESEPLDKNDTAAGKANNRRVEFIRT